jgi:hypothetical protein
MYLLKFIIATVMFFVRENGAMMSYCSTLWQNRWDAAMLMVPASCYAVYDLVSFIALSKVTPGKYQMLLHSKIIFMIPVWQFVMNRSISKFQLKCLVLMASGIVILSLPETIEMFGQKTVGTTDHFAGVCLVLFQVLVSVVASVANEKMLQTRPMSTDFQNSLMYAQSSMLLSFGTFWHWGPSAFAVKEWQAILGSREVMSSIVSLALCGIATAYFLRYLNNIIKEMCNVMVTALATIITWSFVYTDTANSHLLCEYQGLIIVVMAVTLFALAPDGKNELLPTIEKRASLPCDLVKNKNRRVGG